MVLTSSLGELMGDQMLQFCHICKDVCQYIHKHTYIFTRGNTTHTNILTFNNTHT